MAVAGWPLLATQPVFPSSGSRALDWFGVANSDRGLEFGGDIMSVAGLL
jgi:hypothetical protein